MLLLYRKAIKPYVSAAATERFNPYTPLPQSVFPLEFKGTKLSLNPLILYTGTKSVLILLRRLYGQHYNQQIYFNISDLIYSATDYYLVKKN